MYHEPIMVDEVLRLLAPREGGVYVDGTLGGGGHAEAILRVCAAGGGRLIGIDRDPEAIMEASRRLEKYGDAFTPVRGNFFEIKRLLGGLGIDAVDGILLDLGVSSHQLDTAARGFSYHLEAPLDMRMDTTQALSAYTVVNTYEQAALAQIFREYGEERYAGRIAGAIVRAREKEPIETTTQLAEIIKRATPPDKRFMGKHPARRVFQAIRIEVNHELEGLGEALMDAYTLIKPYGKFAIITFHSLEDRLAKLLFRAMENPCVCPPRAPVCTCGRKPMARLLTKKPVLAGEAECEGNARARSAKLRAIEKVPH